MGPGSEKRYADYCHWTVRTVLVESDSERVPIVATDNSASDSDPVSKLKKNKGGNTKTKFTSLRNVWGRIRNKMQSGKKTEGNIKKDSDESAKQGENRNGIFDGYLVSSID